MSSAPARPVRKTRSLRLSVVVALLAATSAHCASGSDRTKREPSSTRVSSELGGWSSALPPIRIRSGNTSTLLGTGEVLIAGGGSTPKSTELLDVYGGTIVLGPDMAAARTRHTATMLTSGKVLVAGGGTASAELYDPIARTFTVTGAMGAARTGHSAVRLRTGKVRVVGESTAELYDPPAGTFSPTSARLTTGNGALVVLANGAALFTNAAGTELFDPAAASGAGAWSLAAASAPAPQAGSLPIVTRLRDGRLYVSAGEGCASNGSNEFCFAKIWSYNATTGATTQAASVTRTDPVAALLPTGDVIYAGGSPTTNATADLVTSAVPAVLSSDGPTAPSHGSDSTAVVLPGGDTLFIGGVQATIDRRSHYGAFHVSASPLATPRVLQGAVRLQDGRVFLSGGGADDGSGPLLASIEIFDPSTDTFTSGGSMTSARYAHTSTVLRSGKVLITGGGKGPSVPTTPLASTELYDPAAPLATRSRALGALAVARISHAATLLPSGEVLITGGCTAGFNGIFGGCPAGKSSTSAELFDPATEKLSALAPMTVARQGHGAVLLPTGKVLVVGGGDASAEIFDPLTKTFKATAPSGSPRDGSTAHVLPNGRVFVAGGQTLAPELFDPATETWSYAPALSASIPNTLWTTMPDGRLLSAGGLFFEAVDIQLRIFDPLAAAVGAASVAANDGRGGRKWGSSTLAGSGEIVIAGGTVCNGLCFSTPEPLALIHDDGAPSSARPVVSAVPMTVTAGTKVTITGAGFTSGPEGSTGTRGSSATNHPLVTWVSDAGDAVVPGTVLDFTETTATWLVPATALYGHGLLFVSTGGVLSVGASVTIAPAGKAVTCAYDAECASGFCTDGVCCDRRCDGKCEGCSAKRKTIGEDGVCGAVPPGRDIAGRCFSASGQACTEALQCATGFCAQGVCCDSSCTGECQSCSQDTHKGVCSPINEGSCGAACDGDHTLKQLGAPDVDCAPFKCEGPRCKTTCASAKDCAAPFVCSLDGQCTAPPEPVPGSGGVCGCTVVGHDARGTNGTLGAAFAVALLAWSRARARRRAR